MNLYEPNRLQNSQQMIFPNEHLSLDSLSLVCTEDWRWSESEVTNPLADMVVIYLGLDSYIVYRRCQIRAK